jgi:murein L,D-transpeptidase YafK
MFAAVTLAAMLLPGPVDIPSSARSEAARARVEPALRRDLQALGASWGAPVHLRIYKQESELDLHVAVDGRYRLFRRYPICTYSGRLGPKLAEGDRQAPEGFYEVRAHQLNPASQYHLSFDLGYPNAFDRALGRTGSYLMVHGRCVSIGCYAMGDAAIEEIWHLVAAALAHGQPAVPVQASPFRFSAGWEAPHADSPWLDFWQQLAAGEAVFERTGRPPRVRVADGRYEIVDAETTAAAADSIQPIRAD